MTTAPLPPIESRRRRRIFIGLLVLTVLLGVAALSLYWLVHPPAL